MSKGRANLPAICVRDIFFRTILRRQNDVGACAAPLKGRRAKDDDRNANVLWKMRSCRELSGARDGRQYHQYHPCNGGIFGGKRQPVPMLTNE